MFILGGSDSSLYQGNLSYTSIISDLILNPHGYWAFKMNGVFIDGFDLNLCEENCMGIADTGSSLIVAPFSQNMSIMYSRFGADNDGVLKCDLDLFRKLPS